MKVLNGVLMRSMQAKDVDLCAHAFLFPWTTFSTSFEKWQRYYKDHVEHTRTVCLLEKGKDVIGYGTLLRVSDYPYFAEKRIPEINDVWISEGERYKGLGTMLITHLASLAREEGYTQVGLGVGLYRDYGTAQKLYWNLGYRPDGQGITYKCLPVVPGKEYPVDDDLILWMIKAL